MSKFRQIYCDFWQNSYIQEELTPEDKLFYLYLMTNTKTTQIGVYSITLKQMAFDLGYSIETIKSLMLRFEEYHKLIKYDTETKEIAILKWGKNFTKGGTPMEACVKKEFEETKNKDLVRLVLPDIKNEKMKNYIENLFEEKKTENVEEDSKNNTSYDTCHDTYHDTGGITNKNKNNNNKKNNNKNKNKEQVRENLHRLNENTIEQDLIYKEFIEQGISEELGMLLIDFLEGRATGEKVKKSEVKFLLMELKGKYSDDETKMKALQYAIASRHKSLVYVPDNEKESKDSALSGISDELLDYAVM